MLCKVNWTCLANTRPHQLHMTAVLVLVNAIVEEALFRIVFFYDLYIPV